MNSVRKPIMLPKIFDSGFRYSFRQFAQQRVINKAEKLLGISKANYQFSTGQILRLYYNE